MHCAPQPDELITAQCRSPDLDCSAGSRSTSRTQWARRRPAARRLRRLRRKAAAVWRGHPVTRHFSTSCFMRHPVKIHCQPLTLFRAGPASGTPAGAAAADDTTEMKLGAWPGPAAGGRQSWAESHDCDPASDRVGPPEAPCAGSFRHFPGEHHNSTESWHW